MKEITLNGKVFELYIPIEKIRSAIAEMATKIRKDMEGKKPIYITILNGSFMYAAELFAELNTGDAVYFTRYASYEGMSSTGELKEIMPLPDYVNLKDRTVVIVEDLIDTGKTLSILVEKYRSMGAKEVFVTTMLSKPGALKYDVKVDYPCIEIPNDFIVGHGLDYDGLGRMYPDIYIVKE